MPQLAALSTAVVIFSLSVPAVAQQGDQYLLLATSRTSTLQSEIDQAVEQGFRVVAASRTGNQEVLVALERSNLPYSYRVLATTRTGTLQREISALATNGYRIVPRAVTTKKTIGGLFSSDDNDEGELLIVMEKGPDTRKASYRVLATSRTGTLQREMSDASAAGYQLIALASRGEYVAIFERNVD